MNLHQRFLFGAVLLGTLCGFTAEAQTQDQPMNLWAGTVPDAVVPTAPETIAAQKLGPKQTGAPIIRASNVSVPQMTVFHPSAALDKHAAVLVFPGGGYQFMAYNLEGTEVCEWLNSVGVTAVLVKYRVPTPAGGTRGKLPLEDAQRAISTVRAHAGEWHIDSGKVGVIGFSAGGDLAARLSNTAARTYPAADEIDKLPTRPDFTMMIYPGQMLAAGSTMQLEPELQVSAGGPPTFLVQAENDALIPNSLAYYSALSLVKVPAEMHLFAEGGHGFGLRKADMPVGAWPKLAQVWMRSLNILR